MVITSLERRVNPHGAVAEGPTAEEPGQQKPGHLCMHGMYEQIIPEAYAQTHLHVGTEVCLRLF